MENCGVFISLKIKKGGGVGKGLQWITSVIPPTPVVQVGRIAV
jgi:hypothetical protein